MLSISLAALAFFGAPVSAQSNSTESTSPTTESASSQSTPTRPTASPPEGAETLALRLRARHTRDLPRAESLRAADDLARLRWLAEHHRLLIVRTRALLLLDGDPSPETRRLVLRVLDSTQAALVRAAALRATTSWPLDRALRARLERLAADPDPRLHGPARHRLAGPPPATD